MFHIPQRANGRTCETCHLPHAGWSVRPADVELSFLLSAGRGLAARALYFHNGSATTLNDVVIHYEAAFGFKFTPQERADLVAFMQAL